MFNLFGVLSVSNRCVIGNIVLQAVLHYSDGHAGGAMRFEGLCRKGNCDMKVCVIKVIGHKYE